jgi:hypothetical protein
MRCARVSRNTTLSCTFQNSEALICVCRKMRCLCVSRNYIVDMTLSCIFQTCEAYVVSHSIHTYALQNMFHSCLRISNTLCAYLAQIYATHTYTLQTSYAHTRVCECVSNPFLCDIQISIATHTHTHTYTHFSNSAHTHIKILHKCLGRLHPECVLVSNRSRAHVQSPDHISRLSAMPKSVTCLSCFQSLTCTSPKY